MKVDKISKEPVPLPDNFEWCAIDLSNDADAALVYELLTENYVEDSEGLFRFDYPIDFMRWTLCSPNHNKNLHIGVRVPGKSKLMGFVSGTIIKT